MAKSSSWQRTLVTAQNEALLAAKLYNEPFTPRVFEGFVVHMHLAWLYLLQAKFMQEGVDFRIRQSKRKDRFEIVDGEHKTWDLATSVKERWKDTPNDPVRMNLEFFIKLRNRIEHRYRRNDDVMLAFVSGKSHALLLNFEEEMTSTFGNRYSLANKLRFPVFIGTFTAPAEEAIVRLNSLLPAELKTFVAEYDSGMDESVLNSSKYSFRLRVNLEKVTSDANMSITFVRDDHLSDEERASLDADAKSGKVIVRSKLQPVYNLGLIRPGMVAKAVSDQIAFTFNLFHLKEAARKFAIRPPNGAANPAETNPDFCVYDEVNKNYLYKPAFVAYLVKKCNTRAGFQDSTGREPKKKV